jgi:uncharacterized membrane protein YfcA
LGSGPFTEPEKKLTYLVSTANMNIYILAACFFAIALIYSSVGFGGGSSYLALLAVIGISRDVFQPAALMCNIIVVTGGAIIFYRTGALDWKRSWPFLMASVPMAFLGGLWRIGDQFFFLLLGFSLVVAAIFLWIQPEESGKRRTDNLVFNLGFGGGIGLLSGLVSIGGGIFLSPALHLMRWGTARKISALASVFILVNSIAGLAGQFARSATIEWKFILPLLVAVFAGGQVGSRLGAQKFNARYIKRITAILILLAGLNILRDHL